MLPSLAQNRGHPVGPLTASTGPAVAQQIQYQDSGRPWIKHGLGFYDQDHDRFPGSGQATQVWKVYHHNKQVLYWWRFVFTPRHVEYLKVKRPGWGKGFDDPRRPLGPYLVDCGSQKGTTSWVQMERGWSYPVLHPVGEGNSSGRVACRSAGFETGW